MFSSIGVIVDGRAEEEFFKATLPGCRTRRNLCNGRDVPLERIARDIITSCESFAEPISAIIAKIDREQRNESRAEIFLTLSDLIADKVRPRLVILAIADRCLENWILADVDKMKELSGLEAYSYDYEGRQGKPILRNVLSAGDIPFIKTARLLAGSNSDCIRRNSASFSHFSSLITFAWPWMNDRDPFVEAET